MAAHGSMNSQHARSPVIKVVAGEDEVFGEDEPDLPVNVFHVSKSLLLENSSYFAIMLDSSPDRTTVFLPEKNYHVVADWLDLIYQGTLDRSSKAALDCNDVQRYFKFADLVGSEQLKNVVMDTMQELSLAEWDFDWLAALEALGLSSSPIMDYVFECLAYKIVDQGWAEFTKERRERGQTTWSEFVGDKDNTDHLQKMLLKVDELNTARDEKRLINPKERRDCKWHEHLSEKIKAKCPRSSSGNAKLRRWYKDKLLETSFAGWHTAGDHTACDVIRTNGHASHEIEA